MCLCGNYNFNIIYNFHIFHSNSIFTIASPSTTHTRRQLSQWNRIAKNIQSRSREKDARNWHRTPLPWYLMLIIMHVLQIRRNIQLGHFDRNECTDLTIISSLFGWRTIRYMHLQQVHLCSKARVLSRCSCRSHLDGYNIKWKVSLETHETAWMSIKIVLLLLLLNAFVKCEMTQFQFCSRQHRTGHWMRIPIHYFNII